MVVSERKNDPAVSSPPALMMIAELPPAACPSPSPCRCITAWPIAQGDDTQPAQHLSTPRVAGFPSIERQKEAGHRTTHRDQQDLESYRERVLPTYQRWRQSICRSGRTWPTIFPRTHAFQMGAFANREGDVEAVDAESVARQLESLGAWSVVLGTRHASAEEVAVRDQLATSVEDRVAEIIMDAAPDEELELSVSSAAAGNTAIGLVASVNLPDGRLVVADFKANIRRIAHEATIQRTGDVTLMSSNGDLLGRAAKPHVPEASHSRADEEPGGVAPSQSLLDKLGRVGRMISDDLLEDEPVSAVYGHKQKAFVLTDHRVIVAQAGASPFGIGASSDSARLSDIVSINAMLGKLTIELTNGSQHILRYGPTILFDAKGNGAKEFVHKVRAAQAPGAPAPAPAAPPSAPAPLGVADELAKFAQLRDQGVLSDEEFQAQKARLLA
jgi:hypothetical protein